MKPIISNIVFTKNRPLQLEAYLRSLRRSIPAELLQTYVIHKVELFQDQYEQLFDQYSDCIVVQESDFHSDLLATLDRIDTRYLLFGIDDVVYFDAVDFQLIEAAFEEHPEDIFGFSFRFSVDSVEKGVNSVGKGANLVGKGANLVEKDADLAPKGGDLVEKVDLPGGSVSRFDWRNGQTPSTRYPFELTSTVYTTSLVKKVIAGTMTANPVIKTLFSPKSPLVRTLSRAIPRKSILKPFGYFFSPNNFESWPCRWCQNHPSILPRFTYFQKLCASAIQVNMVNTTTRQKVPEAEDFTVETLNEKFTQGYRMDIDFVAASKPTIMGCGREFFRLTKHA